MMSNSESRKRLAEAQRGDEAVDVDALVEVFNNHDAEQPECDPSLVCSNPAHLAVEVLASDWLAARDAEQRRLGAEAVGSGSSLVVPRAWVHVPYGPEHVSADEADADYLRSAARNISWSKCLGSNLTATVTALLNGLADQLAAARAAAQVSERDKSGHDGHAPQLNGLLADCPGCTTPPTEDRA